MLGHTGNEFEGVVDCVHACGHACMFVRDGVCGCVYACFHARCLYAAERARAI